VAARVVKASTLPIVIVSAGRANALGFAEHARKTGIYTLNSQPNCLARIVE